MAKAKGSSKSTGSQKISLNTKKKGKAKKNFGPKSEKPKAYVGQGRMR
jgi:hypothetical protein